MDKSTTAQDIMTGRPVTIRDTATVGQALVMLQEMDVRHLPVVGAGRTLVGMVSDRDIRGLPLANALEHVDGPRLDRKITTVMSGDLITINTTTELPEIIETMLDLKVGALPVVDPDDNLVGIVSYMDVLRAVGRDLE